MYHLSTNYLSIITIIIMLNHVKKTIPQSHTSHDNSYGIYTMYTIMSYY